MIRDQGYLRTLPLFSEKEILSILGLFEGIQIRGGLRNVLDIPGILKLCSDPRIVDLVSGILSPKAFAVRGILFDKTEDANWSLDFHRDTKIAVKRRHEIEGYSGWSVKEGVIHVQPPHAVLSRQIAVRIALDDCDHENGPVAVLPGTHLEGASEDVEPVLCVRLAGSVLVFSSLLLHGSARATQPRRRRVLHLEFCDARLPEGLEWNWRVPIGENPIVLAD